MPPLVHHGDNAKDRILLAQSLARRGEGGGEPAPGTGTRYVASPGGGNTLGETEERRDMPTLVCVIDMYEHWRKAMIKNRAAFFMPDCDRIASAIGPKM